MAIQIDGRSDDFLKRTRAFLKNAAKSGDPEIYDKEQVLLDLDDVNREIERRRSGKHSEETNLIVFAGGHDETCGLMDSQDRVVEAENVEVNRMILVDDIEAERLLPKEIFEAFRPGSYLWKIFPAPGGTHNATDFYLVYDDPEMDAPVNAFYLARDENGLRQLRPGERPWHWRKE